MRWMIRTVDKNEYKRFNIAAYVQITQDLNLHHSASRGKINVSTPWSVKLKRTDTHDETMTLYSDIHSL